MSGGEFTPADFAGDVLSRFDRGEWSDPLAMIGHLAAAVRLLLEVVTESGDDAGRLAAVRAVLARFDWEADDRQYALEQIEMIVGGEDE